MPGPGGPDGNARALGSPITIPAFSQIGGQPADKVRAEIEAAIRKACTPNHDLCVQTEVMVVPDENKVADAHACFGGTNPPTKPPPGKADDEVRIPLERDSVLTIYSVQPDCGDSESESSSSSTESSETTQSSSETTESSETTQAPPSSDIGSSESTQSDAGPPSS